MNPDFLDFEQPIADREEKIRELQRVSEKGDVDLDSEIERLRERNQVLTQDIYKKLTPWQITQVARHPLRPYMRDYLGTLFTEFHELHGDQLFADDQAILCGMARLEDIPVMIIGHQKGRGTKEKLEHNFGMPRPEGYRKAGRLMQMAERFNMPVLTFIDTRGLILGLTRRRAARAGPLLATLRLCRS